MQTLKIVFHSDPAHGWAAIPHHLISELGISDQISGFSYTDSQNAYLEEDCDLSLFMRAYKGDIEFIDRYTNHDSPIRSKARYQGAL